MRLFATGTCSDILLMCAKANSFKEPVGMTFYTRHVVYQKPVSDIISACKFISKDSGCLVHTEPHIIAAEEAKKYDGVYFTHSLFDKWYAPNFNLNLNLPKVIQPKTEYICIQMEAGFGKRTISSKFIKLIKQSFAKHVIILGAQHIEVDDVLASDENNRSGRTFSILEAMALINGCIGFIGPNGVLAYYAALQNKPCLVNFEKEDILSKKLLRKHRDNIMPLGQGTMLTKITPEQLNCFIEMINLYKK